MDEKRIANKAAACGYKSGSLDSCAPLAVPYVPFQCENPPQYGADLALARGTLFPGLDLPWKNLANEANPYANTPLGDLMALSFVLDELQLYLDTHQEDADAFAVFQECAALYKKGRKKYVQLYGPISQGDIADAKKYTWLKDPWPWEYKMGTEA